MKKVRNESAIMLAHGTTKTLSLRAWPAISSVIEVSWDCGSSPQWQWEVETLHYVI